MSDFGAASEVEEAEVPAAEAAEEPIQLWSAFQNETGEWSLSTRSEDGTELKSCSLWGDGPWQVVYPDGQTPHVWDGRCAPFDCTIIMQAAPAHTDLLMPKKPQPPPPKRPGKVKDQGSQATVKGRPVKVAPGVAAASKLLPGMKATTVGMAKPCGFGSSHGFTESVRVRLKSIEPLRVLAEVGVMRPRSAMHWRPGIATFRADLNVRQDDTADFSDVDEPSPPELIAEIVDRDGEQFLQFDGKELKLGKPAALGTWRVEKDTSSGNTEWVVTDGKRSKLARNLVALERATARLRVAGTVLMA